MNGLTFSFPEFSVAWLLLTTLVSALVSYVFKIAGEAAERRERVRQDTLRWANPILGAVNDLKHRLDNILDAAGHDALREGYNGQTPEWSVTYDYFMSSTLYVFGQYFAWVRLLQEEMNPEVFPSRQAADTFFRAVWNVADCLLEWPPTRYSCADKRRDTQLFSFEQRAIGELFILRHPDTGRRWCMSYPDFLQKKDDPQFVPHLEPLLSLLKNLSVDSEGDCRWSRLVATRQALGELRDHCERLLRV